ncbi:hypothetical protein ACIQ4I_06270 [Rummeliibacillus sp. NPDC094406]|uniref:hypothetical protein n=1 Tax=Rummeliibacillus sp. NPDC094406 TaxID=3364511 RepID=UPI003818A997
MNYPSLSSVQLLQSNGAMNQQPLALKQGQVIHGTIKQLFPDQMAEIQIGGQRLMAKLEVPLQTGNSHYFQVSGVEPDLQLKVVSGPMAPSASMSQQVTQLLDSMQLPQTNEMKQVATYFLKNDLPLSKEQLQQAEQIMKSLPENVTTKEALNVLQKLIELKLPIQQNTFQAVLQGSMKQGFTDTLGSLQQLLQQDTSIPQAMREQLLNQLQMVSKPLAVETGGVLFAKMLDNLSASASSPADKLTILQLLKDAGIMPKNTNLFNWNMGVTTNTNENNLLQQLTSQIQVGNSKEVASLLPQVKESLQQNLLLSDAQRITLQQAISKAIAQPNAQNIQVIEKAIQMQQQSINSPAKLLNSLQLASPKDMSALLPQLKSAIQGQSLLSATQKEGLLQTLEKFDIANSTPQSIQALAKDLQGQLLKVFSESTQLQPFQSDSQGISAKQQMMLMLNAGQSANEQLFSKLTQLAMNSNSPVLQQMLEQTEQQLAQHLDSKAFETAIKQTLGNLGLSYEAKLLDKSSDIQQLAQQLKPQLLGLLQDDSVSSTTKSVAEQVVARMNGMQYLSGENGPQHQLVMQVPLEFFGKKTEATLQWNGRMKKNGKIDSDYARILFYLQLNSLKETVIDMQVQSRVVTVTLYNETAGLTALAEPLKAALKHGLSQHDYQLSGLFIKNYSKQPVSLKTNTQTTTVDQNKGVDLRI